MIGAGFDAVDDFDALDDFGQLILTIDHRPSTIDHRPDLYERISKDVIRRYVDREGGGAFTHTAPSASKRRLGESGQDLLAIVLQFRGTPAAELESFVILERILREQFDVVGGDDGDQEKPVTVVRAPKDVPCDNVGNPADRLPALMRTRATAILRRLSKPTVRMTMAGMKRSKARPI